MFGCLNPYLPHLHLPCPAVTPACRVSAAQLLAVVDLNDPIVQNTMLAMLPLPEDGKDEGGGGGSAGLRSPAGLREQWVSSGGGGTSEMDAGLPLEGALWPLGQGLLGGSAEPEVEEALGPWLALQQLVVKALFQPETELLALQLLGAIAGQVARSDAAAQQANNAAGGGSEAAASDGGESAWSGGGGGGGADLFSCLSLADGLLLAAADGSGAAAPIEAVLGDLRAGMAISLGASLPWLCVHLREVGPEAVLEGFLEASAGACAALGWLDLADALLALAGMAGTAEEPEQWLPPFCAVSEGAAALLWHVCVPPDARWLSAGSMLPLLLGDVLCTPTAAYRRTTAFLELSRVCVCLLVCASCQYCCNRRSFFRSTACSLPCRPCVGRSSPPTPACCCNGSWRWRSAAPSGTSKPPLLPCEQSFRQAKRPPVSVLLRRRLAGA
jgi:hypothetical protein